MNTSPEITAICVIGAIVVLALIGLASRQHIIFGFAVGMLAMYIAVHVYKT